MSVREHQESLTTMDLRVYPSDATLEDRPGQWIWRRPDSVLVWST